LLSHAGRNSRLLSLALKPTHPNSRYRENAMSDYTKKVNAAGRLWMKGDYRGVLDAYTRMAEEHPDHLGDCQGQIGAAHFLLGNIETAIEFYERALENGAENRRTVEENLKEAREALAKRG